MTPIDVEAIRERFNARKLRCVVTIAQTDMESLLSAIDERDARIAELKTEFAEMQDRMYELEWEREQNSR